MAGVRLNDKHPMCKTELADPGVQRTACAITSSSTNLPGNGTSVTHISLDSGSTDRHDAPQVIDQQFLLRQQLGAEQRQFSVVADHLCPHHLAKPFDVAGE